MGLSVVFRRLPTASSARQLFYGVLIGIALSLTAMSVNDYFEERKRKRAPLVFEPRPIELRSDEVVDGVAGLIGNTPLVRIKSLSTALGVEILGKAEFMNPGGSVKDRVALRMITDAEQRGLLHPHTGSRIFEGTVGSTAIIMPDDVAEEKVKALFALGAHVERVRPASIVDKKQNLARERAKHFGNEEAENPAKAIPTHHGHLITTFSSSVIVTTTADDALADGALMSPGEEREFELMPRGFFADQFENRSNYYAHLDGTGPEIWRQTSGLVDAFVAGAGTGGTLAGIGQYLKNKKENIIVALADPEGSGLFNKVKYGVMFDRKEAEGTKRRHQVDTVVEGIGINRLTHNFELALPIVDDAFRVTDEEAVAMSRYLVHHDGLFLGSSSACNLIACIRLVKKLGWNNDERVVTILCDSGSRHYSKFWNDDYLAKANIPVDMHLVDRILAGDA
ncbi:PALP-domain-containing protein [Dichomitus squalens LYAD-421 SS1]|uniref:PALP-domain-containing protein n=1 Tax=Dichomitus squalens (strain LYAD-421) TaxID=732165 RepID=UPI0004413F6A|nr:PALP-domain-containing protein [Dichomitus squalens LYAD-421 SS1]EJF65014.1 PALP-domain-containing protein [Dichomitus squalens LYAD-421 SS1]